MSSRIIIINKNIRRGFVGPLGDDIPSIFPIAAGILLFLGTIAYAADLVNEKSNYLEIRKAAMGLSYIVTEKGLLSESFFNQKCDSMRSYSQANSVKFLITVKRFCSQVNLYDSSDDEAVSPYFINPSDEPDRTWLSCYLEPADEKLQESISQEKAFSPPPTHVLLNYPVAVPCPTIDSATNGLGLINVIVWR